MSSSKAIAFKKSEKQKEKITKSMKNASAKTATAVEAVKDAMREKSGAVKASAARVTQKISDAAKGTQEKSKSAGKDIKEGYHDITKGIHHIAKGMSGKPKK